MLHATDRVEINSNTTSILILPWQTSTFRIFFLLGGGGGGSSFRVTQTEFKYKPRVNSPRKFRVEITEI